MEKKFLSVLNGQKVKVPPVWLMRQAGRYHSHYQDLKKDYSFEDLCKNPELAARTALGPIEDFDFDVSILFSDILFPLEALGMSLKYNPGPVFDKFIDHSNFDELKDVEDANDDKLNKYVENTNQFVDELISNHSDEIQPLNDSEIEKIIYNF